MMRLLFRLWARELTLCLRYGGDWAASILFFALPPFLWKLATGSIQPSHALAVVYLTALLVMLGGIDRFWRGDWQCGYLDHLRAAPDALILAVWAKILSAMLVLSVPMVLITPAILFSLSGMSLADATAILPVMTLFCVILASLAVMFAAMALPARQSGILILVIALPLAVPLFIFAYGASIALIVGGDWYPPLAGLLAYMLAVLAVCPAVAAYIIKNLES